MPLLQQELAGGSPFQLRSIGNDGLSALVRKILHMGRWGYGPLVMTDQVQVVRFNYPS